MYAIGFVNCGHGGVRMTMGNNGLRKLRNSSPRGILSEISTMRFANDEIFIIPDFSQKMCEMSESKLYDTVRHIGKRV